MSRGRFANIYMMIRSTFSLFGSKKKRNVDSKSKVSRSETQARSTNQSNAALLLLQSKIPPPQPLIDMLSEIVYQKPFTEVNKDILRLIRRVTILYRVKGESETLVVPAEQPIPESLKGKEKEGVYIVMIFMTYLLKYFETEEIASSLINKMEELYKRYEHDLEKLEAKREQQASETLEEEEEDLAEFTVPDLIKCIGGDKTRTALAIKCLHQSIAISGHMHIKSKVCPYLTKDVRDESGWQVLVSLLEYVQVKHTRRESSIESPNMIRNHWEVQFDVHMTFDKLMSEITGTRLTITDLQLSETMDNDLAKYLKDKFHSGNLVVC